MEDFCCGTRLPKTLVSIETVWSWAGQVFDLAHFDVEVPTWTLEQEQEQEQDNDNLKTVSMDLRLFVTNRHTCRTAKLYEGRLQAYGSGGRFETLSVECFGIKLNESGCLWAAKKSQAPWEYGSERPVFKPESLVELLEDSRMVGGDDEEEEEEELEEKQWQRICWSSWPNRPCVLGAMKVCLGTTCIHLVCHAMH